MCIVVQIVYYDGQFDDSRLNVSLACTAAMAGATVLNYAEVTRLIKVRCKCLVMSVDCAPCMCVHQERTPNGAFAWL